MLEQPFEQGTHRLRLAIGGRGRLGRGGCSCVDHTDLDHRLLGRFAHDPDVYVAPRLAKLDQGGIDRLVESSAAAFC